MDNGYIKRMFGREMDKSARCHEVATGETLAGLQMVINPTFIIIMLMLWTTRSAGAVGYVSSHLPA